MRVRSAAGDRYSLSLKLYALAHRHPPMNRLISEALPLMQRFAGAQLLVRVQARAIFPNCPRYIVTPGAGEPSKYAPRYSNSVKSSTDFNARCEPNNR